MLEARTGANRNRDAAASRTENCIMPIDNNGRSSHIFLPLTTSAKRVIDAKDRPGCDVETYNARSTEAP
jgi:hypothetical protein